MYEIYVQLRDGKGVRDSDVAKATGVTKSTFTDWKNGRSAPKDEKLQKIADYFGVSTHYLRTGKELQKIELDAKPLRELQDRIHENLAPGLSQAIKMYTLFDENDRNEILALMKAKLSKYFDEEKETPDEHKSVG